MRAGRLLGFPRTAKSIRSQETMRLSPSFGKMGSSRPSGSLISHPASGLLYALWLPLIGLVATGVGLGSSQNGQKRKLRTAALACALFASLTFQVACGGGSSGTPAETYTITVTATASGNLSSDSVPLTVR